MGSRAHGSKEHIILMRVELWLPKQRSCDSHNIGLESQGPGLAHRDLWLQTYIKLICCSSPNIPGMKANINAFL